MSDEMNGALERLQAKLRQQLDSARKTKLAINALCDAFDQPPLYTEVEEEGRIEHFRPDQFYGQPLATCVRAILEMRKSAGRGAASVNEIFDALTAGGYRFDTKDDDNAKTGLRQSLRKNPIFHKVPGGQWGLLAWYPSAKVEKEDESPSAAKDEASPAAGVDSGNAAPGKRARNQADQGENDKGDL